MAGGHAINHSYDDTKVSLLSDDELSRGTEKKKLPFYRPRMFFLFLFLTVFASGNVFGGSMLTLRVIDLYKQDGYKEDDAVIKATYLNGWLHGIRNVGILLLSPIFGALSDRWGRKPLLIVGVLAVILDHIPYIIGHPIWLFFVTKIILAITDGIQPVAMAALIDVTDPQKRAYGFALHGVCFGISTIGFPALSGWLADKYGFIPVMWISIAIIGLSLLVLIYIPETLAVKSKEPINFWKLNPLSCFWLLTRSSTTMFLSFVMLVLGFALEGVHDSFTPFVKLMFPHTSNFKMGTLGSVGGVGMLISAGLTRFVVPWLGDKASIFIGLFIGTLGIVTVPFIWVWWQLYPIILIRSIAHMASPSLSAIMCAEYALNELAPMFGVLHSLKTISGITGPLIFPPILEHFTLHHTPKMPGVLFYIVGGLNTIALIALVIYFATDRTKLPEMEDIPDSEKPGETLKRKVRSEEARKDRADVIIGGQGGQS